MIALESPVVLELLESVAGIAFLYLVYRAIKGYRAGKPSADDHNSSEDTDAQPQECPSCGAPVAQGQCISCLDDVGRPSSD